MTILSEILSSGITSVKNIKNFIFKRRAGAPGEIKKKVIVDVQHGLSNRLRALISAKLLADMSGRQLLVIWNPDVHCNATFSDLFLNKDIVVSSALYRADLSRADAYNYMDNEEGAEKDKFIDDKSPKDIYVKSAYILNHRYSDWNAENEVLKKLIFHKTVQRVVNNIDVSDSIGVHIRMGGGKGHDTNPWNRPVNWSQEGRERIYYWRERSHYTTFLEEIDRLLDNEPGLTFFLAADNQETYDIFIKKYGDKITYVKRDVFDRSVDQQRYALIDMILLSRTKYILGSYWSSFTELAQRLGNSKVKYSGVDFGKK